MAIYLLTFHVCDIANADEYSELKAVLDQAKEIRTTIDAAKNEYVVAVQQAEEIAAQKKEAEEELERVQKQLADERDKLSNIAVTTYKHTGSYINIVLDAQDWNAFMSNLDYLNHIADDKRETIEEIEKLESRLAEIPPKLAEQEEMARENAAAADASKKAFEQKLDDLELELKSLRSALTDKLNGMDGSSQLSEILDYLSSLGSVTDSQIAIVQSAYRTSYAGGNRCEAWAEAVYRNAGFDVPMLDSAYTGWETYSLGTNKDGIPVGSFVFGSGTSVPWSHVGILVAEGMVLDNEAAASGHKAVSIDEWVSWQTAVSSNNGQSGWFGWGHPDWIDFEDDQ